MSEEQLKAFLEAVKADTGLQEKLKSAENAAAVVAIAKAAGYEISVEDLQKSQSEISDEDLEGVAGRGVGFCLVLDFSIGYLTEKGNEVINRNRY